MTLLFLLLACSAGDPAEAPSHEVASAEPAPAHQGHDPHAQDPHQGMHVEGRPHHGGDHATVTHGFDDVEKWTQVFDDPERDAWQKPAELVAALKLQPGSAVADIGAGTGYFNAHLSRAVGEKGQVIAVDISENLVAHMSQRAAAEGTPNVTARLGAPEDPGLKPGEVDLVLLVDTYHHIDGRTDYFTRLREAVKPGGRLVVVDFKPGELPVGPPEAHRIPQEKVVEELTAAGWTAGESLELLPHQFVQVMLNPEG